MDIKNTYFGFTDNMEAMKKGRVTKLLDKLIRIDSKVMTNKEFIYTELLKGSRPELKENYQTYNKRTGETTKPKNVYALYSNDNTFWIIEKTLFEFALYILNNNYTNEQKTSEYITAEQTKQQEEKQAEENRLAQEKTAREQREQEKQQFEQWLTDQAEQYNNQQRIDIARTIFWEEINQYNRTYVNKLLVCIENIENPSCHETLKNWLHSHNTTSKKVFFCITGIKLPSTDKGTLEILNTITPNQYTGTISVKPKQEQPKQQPKVKTETENTFYIMIQQPTPHFEAVTGEYVSKYGLEMFITEKENGYSLSELKSGALLTNGSSKEELFNNLQNILSRMPIEKVNLMIDQFISKYGLSPKYNNIAV